MLKPGDTFLDVGTNIGYFSHYASTLVGLKGEVVSLEPSCSVLITLAF